MSITAIAYGYRKDGYITGAIGNEIPIHQRCKQLTRYDKIFTALSGNMSPALVTRTVLPTRCGQCIREYTLNTTTDTTLIDTRDTIHRDDNNFAIRGIFHNQCTTMFRNTER